MSFLSLSKADPTAKHQLQKAITARYGVRPLSLDTARLKMIHHTRIHNLIPVDVEITASYRAPYCMRLEIVRKLPLLRWHIPLGSSTECFDGVFITWRNGSKVTHSQKPDEIASVRRYLWAMLCIMLTPLTEEKVTLKSLDEISFEASPQNYPDDVAVVAFNPDSTLNGVIVQRYRFRDGRTLPFIITVEHELQTFDGFTVPVRFSQHWHGEPAVAFRIAAAEANPPIEPSFFHCE
jgi:hypothetical protein